MNNQNKLLNNQKIDYLPPNQYQDTEANISSGYGYEINSLENQVTKLRTLDEPVSETIVFIFILYSFNA